ncbi:MAG: glycoside hydrolase family 70 protein [Streptococcus sp.]
MKLGTNDRLVVNMGAAHKNQAYVHCFSANHRLATYLKDSDVQLDWFAIRIIKGT